MKKFNHLKAFQGILVVTFLFISTISFGQRVSLEPSGGATDDPYSACTNYASTVNIPFYNQGHNPIQYLGVSTTLNATTTTSQPQNSMLNSNATMNAFINLPANHPPGLFRVFLHFFDPVLSEEKTYIIYVEVEDCSNGGNIGNN